MIDALCIIQARLNSTRLPGKMLLTLQGKTLVERAVEQACRIFGARRVVLAVPDRDARYFIAPLMNRDIGTWCRVFPYAGDESDVVSRFWHCAGDWGARENTTIVRWTPDDWRKEDDKIRYTVAGNTRHSVEESVEVFSMDTLDRWYWGKPQYQREHLGHFLPRRPSPPVIDKLPWSVDTMADWSAIKKHFGEAVEWQAIGTEDV